MTGLVSCNSLNFTQEKNLITIILLSASLLEIKIELGGAIGIVLRLRAPSRIANRLLRSKSRRYGLTAHTSLHRKKMMMLYIVGVEKAC